MFRRAVCGLVGLGLVCGSATSSWGMELFNDQKIDSLLERLEKKGVLSAEEVKEVKAEDKKKQKEHSINAGVRLQLRYEYQDTESREKTSDLNIRRLRFQLDGSMWSDIDYKFEIAMDKLEDLSMKDASLTFKHLGPYAHLRVGQFKTPFSRQRITSSSKLQMIDRSPIEVLYPGRDTGFELSGKNILGVLDYAVAAEAGVGDKRKFAKSDNSSWWYDGRVAFHPLGEVPMSEGEYTENFVVEIAANGLYAPDQIAFGENSVNKMFQADKVYTAQKGLLDDIDHGKASFSDITKKAPGLVGDTTIWGPELTISWKRLSLAGEYYKATYRPGDTGAFRKLESEGYFVQGGVFVIPKILQLTGRFDRLDRNTKEKTQDDFRQYIAGINYFPYGDHRYKVQANYVWRREDKDQIDNDSVVLNLQVSY